LLTLAVAQVLLGVRSEARWLRFVPRHLPGAFPYLPRQSGYNKRLRAAVPLIKRLIRVLAADTDVWTDPVWIVDSTPVECARCRPTARRSELAGWAGYGYCASHSRFFWGLRLHLICTPAGLPISWALTDPKLDERQVLMAVLEHDPSLTAARPGLVIVADKGYVSAELDRFLADRAVALLRPSYRNRSPRPGEDLLKPIRQLIESVNDTLKGQLDLELHGGRSIEGRRRPHWSTPPRPHRRHLAQPHHRPTRHPIPDRLRPLIKFGLTRLVALVPVLPDVRWRRRTLEALPCRAHVGGVDDDVAVERVQGARTPEGGRRERAQRGPAGSSRPARAVTIPSRSAAGSHAESGCSVNSRTACRRPSSSLRWKLKSGIGRVCHDSHSSRSASVWGSETVSWL
jgi:Transposase DDE domain